MDGHFRRHRRKRIEIAPVLHSSLYLPHCTSGSKCELSVGWEKSVLGLFCFLFIFIFGVFYYSLFEFCFVFSVFIFILFV